MLDKKWIKSYVLYYHNFFIAWSRPLIQEKMNVLEQVGLSESNLSDNAVNASFHSKVNTLYKHITFNPEQLLNHSPVDGETYLQEEPGTTVFALCVYSGL